MEQETEKDDDENQESKGTVSNQTSQKTNNAVSQAEQIKA